MRVRLTENYQLSTELIIMLNFPLQLLDGAANLWTIAICLLLLGILPLFAFPQSSLPAISSRIFGGFVRIVLIMTIGGLVWIKLGLYTWVTAMMLYASGLAIGWLESKNWKFGQNWRELGQKIAIATVDIFDRGISRNQSIEWLLLPWQATKKLITNRLTQLKWSGPQSILAIVPSVAILSMAIFLRFEHPWQELRFGHADNYDQLLTVQKILFRDIPDLKYLPIFANLSAFISLLSGIHPTKVIQLLNAFLGTTLVLGVGFAIKNLTKSGAAALAATYSLGVYLFTWNLPIYNRLPLTVQNWFGIIRDRVNEALIRQWSLSSLELGAIFLVLALGFCTHLTRAKQRREGFINTIVCTILVLMTAPSLAIVIAIAGFSILFGRQMLLFVVSIAWVLLGLIGLLPNSNLPWLSGLSLTLPIGLALLVGASFFAIASALRLLLFSWAAPVLLTIFISITLVFCLPPPATINYLEYEVSARKAIEMTRIFPRKTWTIAAPVEQLAQTYGSGWFLDLAQFVDEYQNSVNNPNFNFPIETPLFVFVENIPFGSNKPEPPVAFSTLADPTYRNYRSIGGRTKLLNRARQLCDTYLQSHPDSKVYYDDDRLRIYQFSPRKKAS
jgi:hypothetical protein